MLFYWQADSCSPSAEHVVDLQADWPTRPLTRLPAFQPGQPGQPGHLPACRLIRSM